jgi:hypothetical protein
MGRFGIFLVVVAGFLGYLTYTEGSLAFQSSAQPEEISLKSLLARGAAGNAYIIVTDFELCDNLVHQFNERSKENWTHIWIPIVPADEVNRNDKAPLIPKNVKALFFSTKIRNEAELEAKLNQPKVQGMVTNRITSLETKIRNLLQQSYPETNFDTCLIIQEGRTPFSRGIVYLFGAGAAVVLIAGLAVLFIAWRKGSW